MTIWRNPERDELIQEIQTIEEYREREASKVKEAKLALSDAAKLKILQKVITTKLDSGTAKLIEKSYEEMLLLVHEVNKLQ